MIKIPTTSDSFLTFSHESLLDVGDGEAWPCGYRSDQHRARLPVTRKDLTEALEDASAVLWELGLYGLVSSVKHRCHTIVHEIDDLLNRVETSELPYTHVTTCLILTKESEDRVVTVGTGQSHCSATDNFSKRTGRWYAMTRAIEDAHNRLGECRAAEEAVLDAYFNRYITAKQVRMAPQQRLLSLQSSKARAERREYQEWLNTTYRQHKKESTSVQMDQAATAEKR